MKNVSNSLEVTNSGFWRTIKFEQTLMISTTICEKKIPQTIQAKWVFCTKQEAYLCFAHCIKYFILIFLCRRNECVKHIVVGIGENQL